MTYNEVYSLVMDRSEILFAACRPMSDADLGAVQVVVYHKPNGAENFREDFIGTFAKGTTVDHCLKRANSEYASDKNIVARFYSYECDSL